MIAVAIHEHAILEYHPLMQDARSIRQILRIYLLLTYLGILVSVSGYLREARFSHWIVGAFAGCMLILYGVAYLLPVILLLSAARWVLFRKRMSLFLQRIRISPAVLLCIMAVTLTSIVQILLYADRFIFHLYGFHLNGFVWNLVFTRGGFESLGGDAPTTFTFVGILLGLVCIQVVLMVAVLSAPRIRQRVVLLLGRRALVWAAVCLLVVGVFGKMAYGVSFIRGYTPILTASNVFPLYIPLTFTRLAERLGANVTRPASLEVDLDGSGLIYPLKPLNFQPPAKPLNIVLLVGESLRADMLTAEIMPQTWALAQESLWCRQHYSGGNGTRMGMFSLLYGLYGSYWFSFLGENRGSLLIDALLDQNYQIELFTSAGFSYPEFDKTIFARVEPQRMHERICLPQWRCDQQQVEAMLESIGARDRSRPFMTFMFFESPHANYHFPPDAVVVKPYAETMNYATMDVVRDIGLIKNRYINACHHLDMQVKRVIDYLRKENLLDSTIVLVTGDHGEEFMEKGRWGHNSTFSEEQTRPPFVLWVPGKQPRRLDRMTSHLDLVPTLMPMLGVTNPPNDYSCGYDLYGNSEREFTILSDWSRVAYVTQDSKVVFSFRSYRFDPPTVTARDDSEIADPDGYFVAHKRELMDVMRGLKTFIRR